jgi:[NiFe] hydrogenase diaphorase moiety small subunit
VLDKHLGETMTDEMADYAMEVCPVGSILVKEQGFKTPVGERKFDKGVIGADVETAKTIDHG